MSAAQVERRYAMTRIQSGDYLFPSNDGTRLWRVSRYEEDGSLETDDGFVIRGMFWSAAYFDGTMDQAERLLARDPDEFLSWTCWVSCSNLLPTRAEAIKAALV